MRTKIEEISWRCLYTNKAHYHVVVEVFVSDTMSIGI